MSLSFGGDGYAGRDPRPYLDAGLIPTNQPPKGAWSKPRRNWPREGPLSPELVAAYPGLFRVRADR